MTRMRQDVRSHPSRTVEIAFLPATDPADSAYGRPPLHLPEGSGLSIRQVQYPTQVWYNREIREQAAAQLWTEPNTPVVLVGFSKSGLGAWNLTRENPDRVLATLIFDAPMVMETLPDWETEMFYADDTAWQEDLPLRTAGNFDSVMPDTHLLILISGEHFHDQMSEMSRRLTQQGRQHVFFPRPHLKHHWGSGWLEEGLACLQAHLQSRESAD